jgi:hypothetical protein
MLRVNREKLERSLQIKHSGNHNMTPNSMRTIEQIKNTTIENSLSLRLLLEKGVAPITIFLV